jgi:glycosyltransferase involved in cell wall biosynthesis
MKMAAFLRRRSSLVEDFVRFHPASQAVRCLASRGLAGMKDAEDPVWLDHACAAARCAPSPKWMRAIERWMLRRLDRLPSEVLWRWQPAPQARVEVRKSAILKFPSPGEKGVVFISFESQWEKLLALGPERLAAFSADYDLVVAPTWSPPHSVTNLIFPRLFPGVLPCTLSNPADLEIFPRLHTSYRPVRLFASSWVNPDLYQPRPRDERDIDLLMVANFGRYKRHHVLFRALSRIPEERRPKVVLVGQPHDDRTAEVLLREMDDHGVRDCITLRSRISDAEVVGTLCRSKAAVITSLREGSCVAVVEAMMANTPIGLIKGAHIGSAAFLNDQTGRWLDGERLDEALTAFLRESDRLAPRAWLIENGIECRTSTRALAEHLRALALTSGRPWTRGLFEHHWRPDPVLLSAADASQATVARGELEKRLGLVLI